jgi:uncharacterized membrane protein YgdD (TMEM256/DUF423 family)
MAVSSVSSGVAAPASAVANARVLSAPARALLVIGSVSAGLAVAAGAFGAHALKASLPPELLAVFDTAARYQLLHALALLVTGVALALWPRRLFAAAGIAFVAGSVLFSGSLYLLALTGGRAWGAVTPFGGVAFIAGWALLAAGFWRASEAQR